MSPGRPPKPADQKRTERVNVRLTRAEYDRLCRVSLVLRMGVADLVRLMVLPETVNVPAPLPSPPKYKM
jgi:hypothetical protein